MSIRAGASEPLGALAESSAAQIAQRPALRVKSALRAQLYASYLLTDVAMIALTVFASAAIRQGFGQAFDLARNTIILVLPIYTLLAFNLGAFQVKTLVSTAHSIQRAMAAYLAAMTTTVLILFFLKTSQDYSRLAFGLMVIIGAVLIALGRVATRNLSRKLLRDRVETTVLILDGRGGRIGPADIVLDAAVHGLRPSLTDPDALDRLGWYLKGADRVVVECPMERRIAWAATLKGLGVIAEIVVPELDIMGAIGTGTIGGRSTAVVGRGPLGTRDRILKRLFDIAVVIWSLPVMLPLCVAIALAIKLESRGPVLFSQTRVGHANRQFQLWKFRSMRADLLDAEGRVSTLRDDHRVTRVGRFIRATSLDELPQLFNVLKGEMSIVGPRPHALASTADDALFWEIDERYWHRHAAKPGLTGLAQIRGHRGATESTGALVDRIQSDLEYLADWSIWRDMRILFWTIRVVLHPNAY